MQIRISGCISCLVAALLCCFSVLAAEPSAFDVLFARAEAAFKQGDMAAALPAFQEAFKLKPEAIGINYYLGRCYYEMNDYENALMAFDRASILDPASEQIKMELGRTYYQLKLYDLARPCFNEVLKSQPPPVVQTVADAYLKKMDASEKQHFFSGSVTLGLTYDDNVNVGPANSLISTVLGQVALSGASLRQRDWYYSDNVCLDYRYRFSDRAWSWHTNGVLYDAYYDTAKSLNLDYYAAASGLAWENDRFSLEIQPSVWYLEKDYRVYMDAYGATASAGYIVTPNLMLTTALQGEVKHYLSDDVRDAVNGAVMGGPVWCYGPHKATLRVGYEKEDATIDVWSYDKVFGSLRYDRQLPWGVTSYGGYRVQQVHYDEPNPLFARDRSETIHDFFVGVTKSITKNLSVDLNYTYTYSGSTIVLYDYERNVVAFSLKLAF